jgi:chromosome partitioning protein
MDLSRVVSLANGKGGVGKTSLTANLAGEFAREGSRTLVVDLDVSGNLKLDLGLVGHEGDDAGRGVVDAIVEGTPLNIVRDVRPGIDWIPGGARLNWLLPMTYGAGPGIPAGSVGEGWRQALGKAIAEGEYDMVLVDTPPGNRELQQMALTAARWILVPLRSDPASWEGLQVLGPLVSHARKDNTELRWLGMVLFGHQSTATRVRQNVLDNLADDHSAIPLLQTAIRSSEKTAQECRLRGLLVRELVDRAASDPSERFRALRARRSDPTVSIPESLPQSSTSMAEDYAELAAEVAALILEAEEAS